MVTESELRDLFASAEAAPGTRKLDAGRIIARSRARRLPRQLAVGAVGALAVVGIAAGGMQLFLRPPVSSSLSQGVSAPTAGTSLDSRAATAPPDRCGGGLAPIAPSPSGLRLELAFPATAPSGASAIEGAVRLTNTSSVRVTGTTAATPTITLSQGGIVLWHSNGPTAMIAAAVDLAPGESREYRASFVPVRCGAEDELPGGFRETLPALPAGSYELSAALDFNPDATASPATPGPEPLSARSTITLR